MVSVAPDPARFHPGRAERLNDPGRLSTQVSDEDLARLLALSGSEDLLDLGSGTGFYTDRIAALTTGTVYAVELQPEMIDHYQRRGVPANVRLVPGDVTDLSFFQGRVDVACSIATWHEAGGHLDLPTLAEIVKRGGRLVVIDWRRDPESWEGGPPEALRSTKEQVAEALLPHFIAATAENLGRSMFAVVADRVEPASGA